jgi:hypothetical protein
VPTTHAEAVELIAQQDLPPKEREGAFIYGYYMKRTGTPYQYYEPEDIFNGKFKGKYLRVSPVLDKLSILEGKLTKLRKLISSKI